MFGIVTDCKSVFELHGAFERVEDCKSRPAREVYAKYVDPNSSNWTGALSTLMSQIAASTAGVVIDGAGYGSSTSSFPPAYLGLQSTTNNGAPKAYLNWLIFDRNYVFVTGGFKQISTAAKEAGTDVAHERVAPDGGDISITQPGYVYIYLSNEETTPVEVYFDDLKVTQIKSPVVQMDDYYPFGLSFNEYQRENALLNKFQYNGKELQKDLSLNWLDYGARMYTPEIGRWHRADKKAELYTNMSPYCYAANTPVNAIDPDGNLVIFINGMSWGSGGSREYWRGKITENVKEEYPDGSFTTTKLPGRSYDFAAEFCKNLGEDINDAKYYDGAPSNDPMPSFREMKGEMQGEKDIAIIIHSLDRTHGGVITEPLILATHSFGAAYGRGFLKAIIAYVKKHPEECVGLSISVYDFDPADASYLKKVYGVNIVQIIHHGFFAEQKEQGASEEDGTLIDDTSHSDSHAVVSFAESFDRLKPGSYVWNGSAFVLKEEAKKDK